MIAFKLILEGLGLGFLLYLICAVGIRNGATGMVHLYGSKGTGVRRSVRLDDRGGNPETECTFQKGAKKWSL